MDETQTDNINALRDKIAQRIKQACETRYLDPHGLITYVLDGTEPSGFLEAVLRDSLSEAAARADDHNGPRLYEWAVVMYNYVPNDARGSREKVNHWIAHRGMAGLQGRQS